MNRQFFERNNIFLGIILGTVIPVITFGFLYFFTNIVPELVFQKSDLLKTTTILLISLIPNAFLMRYYLLRLQLDKTGRGILLITFVYILTYFILIKFL